MRLISSTPSGKSRGLDCSQLPDNLHSMDRYFEKHLLETYPELQDWKRTPTHVRLEIYTLLSDRGRAYVQMHLMDRPEEAKKIWANRACDNPEHHACPNCGTIPTVIGGDLDLVCLNTKCPIVLAYADPESAHPWTGYNHVKASDASCGDLRWDSWDW